MSISSLLPKLPLALLCLGLILTMATSPALAEHVQCGDVITQDTTLDSDLVDCPGDGVVIGADEITLDLAGHTIDGIGDNQGVQSLFRDGITVSNGTIQQFREAVRVQFGRTSLFTDLELTDSDSAVWLEWAWSTRVRDSRISRSFGGIGARDSQFIEINRNVIHSTRVPIHIPTFLIEATRITITDNHVFDNGTGLSVNGLQTLIARNSVHDNGGPGGIIDRSSFARIEENIMRGNAGHGILLPGREQRRSKQLVGNRVVDNGEDGIFVSATIERAHVELADNFARGNGDDGIDTDTPDATLARNKAIHNGDFGIEAVPEVTDGGGNKAHGNGNPAQCLNVRCK